MAKEEEWSLSRMFGAIVSDWLKRVTEAGALVDDHTHTAFRRAILAEVGRR